MNVWFSDPCLYGAALLGNSGYRSSSKTTGEFLSGISPRKPPTGEYVLHSLYYSTERGRLLIGYLPSEIQGAFSRRKTLLGESSEGTTHSAAGSSIYNKPSPTSLPP